eukprot:12566229-Alexandrium_andersonii.AAC.1
MSEPQFRTTCIRVPREGTKICGLRTSCASPDASGSRIRITAAGIRVHVAEPHFRSMPHVTARCVRAACIRVSGLSAS